MSVYHYASTVRLKSFWAYNDGVNSFYVVVIMQFYLPFRRRLSLTNDHIPSAPVVPADYELLGCWNCASEGWVSLPNGEGGEYTQRCRICSTIGEVRVSTELFDFDPDWLDYEPPLQLSSVNGPLPLFFPDTG